DEGDERRAQSQVGSKLEEEAIGDVRGRVLLGYQLDRVRDGLKKAELADAGRPEPVLNPPGHLSLEPGEEEGGNGEERDKNGPDHQARGDQIERLRQERKQVRHNESEYGPEEEFSIAGRRVGNAATSDVKTWRVRVLPPLPCFGGEGWG